MRALILSLLVAAPLLAQGPPKLELRAPEELEAALGVQWYGVYFQEKKSGWAQMECVRGPPFGDCSEHAALFTTLARAAGIPTRTVGGVMYMGDEEKAFGAHAWNEVVLDGVWVPVDPTADQPRIDASHIRFGHDGGPDASARLHGKLRLVLVAAERREE